MAPLPVDYKRALFWSHRSAMAGNKTAQLGYGMLLFGGLGTEPDRVAGHRWVAAVAATGDVHGKEMLQMMEAKMSEGELRRASFR